MAMDLQFKPFSGVGILNFFHRHAVSGAIVGGGYDMGESSKLSIGNSAPKVEMKTSRVTSRGVAFSMAQEKASTLSIEVRTLNDFILGLLTSGSWTEQAGSAAVDGWAAPTGLVAQQVIKLPHQNVSGVSVTDSSGSPKTLPPSQYELDPMGGTIKLLDITTGAPYVQPFLTDYTPGAIKVLGAFKAPDQDFTLHFNGTNAYDSSRVIVEVFKFRFAPEGELALIETEFGTYQLNGSIQLDETKASDAVGGQFYKLIKAGA